MNDKIKLCDVLKLIEGVDFPPIIAEGENGYTAIDSRPCSIFKVCICFMSESETWVHTYPRNEILVPWYECEVTSVFPNEADELQIWLNDVDYIKGLLKVYNNEQTN